MQGPRRGTSISNFSAAFPLSLIRPKSSCSRPLPLPTATPNSQLPNLHDNLNLPTYTNTLPSTFSHLEQLLTSSPVSPNSYHYPAARGQSFCQTVQREPVVQFSPAAPPSVGLSLSLAAARVKLTTASAYEICPPLRSSTRFAAPSTRDAVSR